MNNYAILVARIMMPVLFIVAGYGKLGMLMQELSNICRQWVFGGIAAVNHSA